MALIAREVARARYQRPLLKLLRAQQRLERAVIGRILDREAAPVYVADFEAENVIQRARKLWSEGKRTV